LPPARRHNLPVPLTSCVGGDSVLESLDELAIEWGREYNFV
jgi:hypothetical protein